MPALTINYLDYKYRLTLQTLNEQPIGELVGLTALSYSPNLVGAGELTFSIERDLVDSNGEVICNAIYDMVGEDTLVIVDEKEYYYIDSSKEIREESSGAYRKEIHAYRREYELSLKRFGAYEPETERFLYFRHPSDGASVSYPWSTIPSDNRLNEFLKETKDEDGYFWGIFNEIERLTTWRLKRGSDGKPEIPSSINKEVRLLSFSEENILEVLNKIQELWGIVFIYNTKDRVIDIKTRADFGETPNGVLSNKTFISNLSKEIKKSEIKTRLFLYNADGDGVVAERMAHGNPYIEDYSYFTTSEYMSSHLIAAINTYQTTLTQLQTQVTQKWMELRALFREAAETQTKIRNWEDDLIGPSMSYDYYLSIEQGYIVDKGLPTEQVITEPRELTEEEKASKKAAKDQIDALTRNINLYTTGTSSSLSPRSLKQLDEAVIAKKNEIKTIQAATLMSSVFSQYESLHGLPSNSLSKEMEPFIRDAVYQDESIEDSLDLFNRGMEILTEVSKPKINFEMSLVDFLSDVSLNDSWHLAELGQIIRVEDEDANFIENVLLLKYTHDPIAKSLTFEFSNNLKIDNNTTFLSELISKSASISNQVSFNSNYWARGGAAASGGGVGSGNVVGDLFANYIQANRIVAGEIEAERIRTGELIANSIAAERIVTESLIANEIQAAEGRFGLIIADEIQATEARINQLYTTRAEIGQLVADSIVSDIVITNALDAEYANIDFANINFAQIASAKIEELSARIIQSEQITTNFLTANQISANYATIQNLTANYITASAIQAQYADINLANISTGIINTVLSQDLLAGDGTINNLRVIDANIVELNAGKITAGILSAERIMLQGTDPEGNKIGLLLGLNNIGELVSQNVDSLDGYILTNNTVHAEKIIAESITAREIAAGTITADKILAGSITSASGVIGALDAGSITSGTLDASKVAIQNLDANIIKTGRLQSLNELFFLDFESGYFNLGGVLKYDQSGISLSISGKSAEEYIADQVPHQIYSFPPQVLINTDSTGRVNQPQSFNVSIPVYLGSTMVGATLTGIHLRDNAGNSIAATQFSSSVVNPTPTAPGTITLNFAAGFSPAADLGTVRVTVTTEGNPYFYSIGWSKNKSLPNTYRVQIISSQGHTFKNGSISTNLQALVYKDNQEYDVSGSLLNYTWKRGSGNSSADNTWNQSKVNAGKTISITSADLTTTASFFCEVTYKI